MRRTLFGNTGYGLDTLGTEETVTKLKAADLKSFHQKLVSPKNCVLAIFGDVKASEVKAAVQKAFANWKGTPAPAGSPTFKLPNCRIGTGAPKRVEEIARQKAGRGRHRFRRHDHARRRPLRARFVAGSVQRPWLAPVSARARKAGPGLLRRRAAFSRTRARLFRLLRRHGTDQGRLWSNRNFLRKRNCCAPKA